MCGIAGIIYSDRTRPVDESRLLAARDRMAHRGPDGAGIYVEPGAGLAHRRLKVIDLSDAAAQPMANERGDLRLIYNGEIYNYRELRHGLEKEGVRFRSHSDTEVLLYLYERSGPACLDQLLGMFAFAIWDTKQRQLFAARDRLGQKPFCYAHGTDYFAFASEIAALLAFAEVSAEPDREALGHYLVLQYIPQPWTAYRQIRKLPPAHYLIWKEGHIQTKRYWAPAFLPKSPRTFKAAQEELLERLKQATLSQLVSDVPLGMLLSGGVDSSGITALAAGASDRPLQTFSIGYHQRDYDELHYAELVAQRYRTEHYQFRIEPQALEILPRLIWHFGEPFADSSALATWYVCQAARKQVTVALNGDGGDENFGGYGRYRTMSHAAWLRLLPRPLRRLLAGLGELIPRRAERYPAGTRWRQFLRAAGQPLGSAFCSWVAYFPPTQLHSLLAADFLRGYTLSAMPAMFEQTLARTPTQNAAEAGMALDLLHYLPDDLLVKIDIMSMAHSLESRSPMLDHRFVEFAASLPTDLKVRGAEHKRLLKAALAPLLPPRAVFRPKMGFTVPIEHWFRGSIPLRTYLRETLLTRRALERGYFNRRETERLLVEHEGGINRHFQLWSLLVFELWHRQFIDGDRAKTLSVSGL